MYRNFFFVAGLVLASTAQAQTPWASIMRHIAVASPTGGTPGGRQIGYRISPAARASFPDAPIDGSRALLARWPSASRSSFRAEIRGDASSSPWGEAEFGGVQNPDGSSGAFVVSLGACSPQGAILFTRRSATPLHVGRYRVSAGAEGENEVMAMVLTGGPTHPTGAFHGESGWLVVTAATDRFMAGSFQVDAIGFVAADPQREDQRVNVTGSFSASVSPSFRVCGEA